HLDEAALLAAAADPEREYVERILPRKVAQAAAYAERATLASDVAVLARTARALWQRARP
ncbi:MAG: sugar transferase, partial [Betaproteobacteria bacterium]